MTCIVRYARYASKVVTQTWALYKNIKDVQVDILRQLNAL